MNNTSHVIVIGGGISGMATALALEDLVRQRHLVPPQVTLLEAQKHVGGKIRTLHADGFTCEWGVNGFLNKEPKTIELCQRLQLDPTLQPAAAAFNKRYIYTRQKLRQVHTHPLRFMLSGLLPLGGRWRLLREPWIKAQAPEGKDESVAEFARRRVGPLAYQTLVDPMQTGIFAGDPERLSVASCFPRVVEVERDYGSLIRGMAHLARQRKQQGGPLPGAGPAGHLTSFRGGMQVLTDRLAQELGARVHLGCPATSLSREQGRWRVTSAGLGEPLIADAVVLACPAHAAAMLTRPLDPSLSATLEEIPYPPMAVICLGYRQEQMKRPLDGFGYLIPRTARMRILGTLWSSSIFPDDAPAGHVLLRVMIGGARDLSVLELSDEELLTLVAQEVDHIQGVDGLPCFSRVFRHERAIPQYTVGHAARLVHLAQRLESHPRLFITGNAYRGISVNDCARNARLMAEEITGQLNLPST
jgi:protoporphyrinogen/coproporphyrinogen III oxidase